MYFQVRDVSATGFRLTCSLRNKFLIPDIPLTLTATFPLIGHIVIPVKVRRIGLTTTHGKDQLEVGVEFTSVDRIARETIGQYLIQFSNVESLETLREMDFIPKSVAKGVDFHYLKSDEDYRRVLALRFEAHTVDGNLASGLTTEKDMGDINDAHARIVVGTYRSSVVATARLRFNDADTPLEHEAFVEWPANLPRREQITEVSRVCTHPDFRRGDLLASMFRFIVDSIIHTERPWVLIGSWPSMVPFYEDIGFKTVGIEHREPLWKDQQILMITNLFDMMLGRGVHPVYWNVIWYPLTDRLFDLQRLETTKMDRVRLLIYRSMRPVSRLHFWLRHRIRFRFGA